ncbi:hypothetical protein [Kordia sp.]|uniref:hypothetical protein n=1 Tax=Kordia sp. TaxID=1965332 RepID=UPI003D2DEE98
MKTIKKVTKITLLLLTSFFMLYSCLHDDDTDEDLQNLSSINSISFDTNNYNLLSNERGFQKSEDYVYYSKESKTFLNVSKITTKENSDDLSSILVSFTKVDEENLNSIISSFPSSFDIVTITLAKNGNNIVNGIIIHYLDSDNNMKIEIFDKDEDLDIYNLVEFPAKKVDNYTLDNILFIAKTLFPDHDIEALGIEEMQTITSNSKYNDVALLNFASRYGYDNEGRFPPSFDPGGNTKPCGLTHHCQNGNDVMTNCQPFAQGCQEEPDICSKESSARAMTNNNMIVEYDIFNNSLPNNKLYSLRDLLNTNSKGKFYVEAYYAISRHFKSSIDIEVLYKISTASPEIGNFVQAFINDDRDFVLTEELYNSIIEVAQVSTDNSDSDLYKNIMTELINTTSQYKNKNIGEIKNLLN